MYRKFKNENIFFDRDLIKPQNQFVSMCDQTSDLWQQIELPSVLESDLQDNVHWDRKWLVNFFA